VSSVVKDFAFDVPVLPRVLRGKDFAFAFDVPRVPPCPPRLKILPFDRSESALATPAS